MQYLKRYEIEAAELNFVSTTFFLGGGVEGWGGGVGWFEKICGVIRIAVFLGWSQNLL